MRKIYTSIIFFSIYCLLPAQSNLFVSQKDTVLIRAEQMPYFTGCEAFIDDNNEKRKCSDLELVRFLSRYLVYPEKAKYDGIEGTVFVSFIIDEKGAIYQPTVLKDIGGGCGEAALNVIKEMPNWEPGIHNGKRVKVRMNLPIQFFLRAKGIDEAEPYSISWGNLNGKQVTKDQLNDNASKKIYVRGPEGSNRYVDQIEFIYQKDSRLISASSRGEVSTELLKVVERIKKGGTFTINASVQDGGQFITVSRSFLIVK